MKFIGVVFLVLAVFGGVYSFQNMAAYHWVESMKPGHPFIDAYLLRAGVLAVYAGVACLAAVEDDFKEFAIIIGLANAFFCIFSPFIALTPHPMDMGVLNTDVGIGTILLGILYLIVFIPIKLVQIPLFLVYPFLLGFGIVMVLPYFILGLWTILLAIYTVFIPSHTVDLARQHARTKIPSDDIEKQIAEAIESGLSTDETIKDMIDELPAFTRAKHTFTYKHKAEKYRKMRELIEAQTQALNEKNKLALAAHELERKKRGHYD